MKKIIALFIFTLIFSTFLMSAEVGVLLKVPGITWPGTAHRVSSTLKAIEGVNIVNTSVPRKEVFVKFDDSKVNVKKLLSALEKVGYKAEILKNAKWDLI